MARRRPEAPPELWVFVAAIAATATLLAWWGLFARRMILAYAEKSARYVQFVDSLRGIDVQVEVDEIWARANRQLFMIAGEGGLLAFLLVVLLFSLFLIARQRRMAVERLERLLQFTTHELKTPIAAVRALLQSLQIGSIPEAMRERLLQQGLGETDRLEHLVETILAYQRAASKLRVKLAPANGAEILDEVLEHRAHSFGPEAVQRVARRDVQVRVDRDGLRVVLENILDNARKYGGGKVVLREAVEDGRWVVCIEDQGMGFEPADADVLFDPFSRKDREGTHHGSGLGLYISRQLVRDMGGDLSARSDGPGKGSTFRIALPVLAQADSRVESSSDGRP